MLRTRRLPPDRVVVIVVALAAALLAGWLGHPPLGGPAATRDEAPRACCWP